MKLLLLSLLLCLSLSIFAQVGIGVAVPHPSAELDVTATNRGFLPPRVTKAQRDSIVSPATGLMIFCTNCTPKGDPQFYDGTKWGSMNAAPGVHTIGESYGGGIVIFVTTDGLHGLIAESQEQTLSSNWYEAQSLATRNTLHSPAGKLFADWRLPTLDELSLMYAQKKIIGGKAYGNPYALYWSSTEQNTTAGWYIDFTDGYQNYSDKFSSYRYVRAVRSF
jgi:hypothetical protein